MNIPGREVELDERDGRYLRKAIAWSHLAARGGNGAFGAVVVSNAGEIWSEAYNNTFETGDSTGHAETNAIRALAGRGLDADALAGATLYASCEPCAMCAGAIVWSGVGRVVFGIDMAHLRQLRGSTSNADAIALSCREVLAAASRRVECVGPAMRDEAGAPHVNASKD